MRRLILSLAQACAMVQAVHADATFFRQFDVVEMWESDTGDKLQLVYLLSRPDAATM